jgi:hypothetical protein
VSRRATVGVDDDLAPGEASISLRASDVENARRVDVNLHVSRVELSSVEHRSDHQFGDFILQSRFVNRRRVLGRQHDRVDGARYRPLVADGRLRLAVRSQVVDEASLPHLGKALGEAMRDPYRNRHVFGSFLRRVAEHDALVSSTL